MALCTSVTGEKTNNMAKGKKFGLMELNMKVTTIWAVNKVTVSSSGLTAQNTKAIFVITVLTVKVLTNGKTDESILENGKKIKWKAQESSLGQMDENMRGSTETIRRKAKELSRGMMVGNTSEDG